MNRNILNAFNLVLVWYFCIKFLKRGWTKLETSKRGWKRKTGWSFFLQQVTYLKFGLNFPQYLLFQYQRSSFYKYVLTNNLSNATKIFLWTHQHWLSCLPVNTAFNDSGLQSFTTSSMPLHFIYFPIIPENAGKSWQLPKWIITFFHFSRWFQIKWYIFMVKCHVKWSLREVSCEHIVFVILSYHLCLFGNIVWFSKNFK